MESRISLALANKLRILFEHDDKFLTYPLGVGFDYRYLSFMQDPAVSGLSLQEQLNNKGDFARLMNFIPDDSPTFSPDSDRMLWDAVKNVLIAANYATNGLTAAENDQLDAAIAFLTDEQTADDGSKVPVYSAAVRAYYEYKTAYEAAERTYLDEKITVESTTGAEGDRLKAEWSAYREQQLQDARDRAMQDWTTLGYKLQVEQQQAIRRQLEPKKFLQLQAQAYLNDIELSEIPDLTGNPIGFCTTFFSPSDVFDPATTWTRISLTRAEIDTLIAGAPASLAALFGAGQGGDDGIVSVTLEYNNVPVIRPWFHPEFFESRCWKLADDSVVADGAVPRQGTIPAYITSLLVVRNVAVTRKKSTAEQPVVLPIIGREALRDLKFDPPAELDMAKLRAERSATAARLAEIARMFEPLGPPVRDMPSPLHGAATSKPRLFSERHAFTELQPLPSRASILEKFAELSEVQRREYIDAKYDGMTIKSPRIDLPPLRTEETTAPEGEALVTEPYAFPGVAVLAYVCKRVPRSPDPDMTLTWAG